MANKEVSKKRQKRSSLSKYLWMFVMSLATVFFFSEVVKEFQTQRDLKADIQESEQVINELQGQKEQLEVMEKNLANPEYLQRLARGKFMYTKDNGEQVFKLPEETK